LTTEIRDAFKTPEEIRTPKLNKLPYLHTCIEESLRIAPPKPGSVPRIVLKGGTEIDGHHIPAGTTVGVAHYVIHRDPAVFASPNEFVPERWIESDSVSSEQIALQRKSFCPFGIGPMNCIGKNVAYLATKLALAHLLWRFDLRLHSNKLIGGGSKDAEEGRKDETEYQLWDWIIGFPQGPLIEVKLKK
jgi:cytochrome P450